MISGPAFAEEESQAARATLCGPPYAHLAERPALRSGQVPNSLILGGGRLKVRQPPARRVDDHELSLPSWAA